MQLILPDDSVPVKEMFERFFATESTPERVRAAEPVGFDAALWRELVGLEAPFMRLAPAAGGRAARGIARRAAASGRAGRRRGGQMDRGGARRRDRPYACAEAGAAR